VNIAPSVTSRLILTVAFLQARLKPTKEVAAMSLILSYVNIAPSITSRLTLTVAFLQARLKPTQEIAAMSLWVLVKIVLITTHCCSLRCLKKVQPITTLT